MPDHGKLEADTVSPEKVSGQARNLERDRHVVALGQRGLAMMKLAGILESSQLQCEQLAFGYFRQHVNQLLLYQLETADRPIELSPRLRILYRAMVASHRCPQGAPGDAVPRLVEAHQGRFQPGCAGEQVFLRNRTIFKNELRCDRGAQ